MAGYWGLKAIADRMGWKYARTPIKQATLYGFPIYRRLKNSRLQWYVTDDLIHLWELGRIKTDREMLLERARRKKQSKGTVCGEQAPDQATGNNIQG